METTPNAFNLPIASLLTNAPALGCEQANKRPGRPQTRTQDYFNQLLRQHFDLVRWFTNAFGRPPNTDVELLNKHFEAECSRLGFRPTRVKSEVIQGRIKTIRNQLSEARRLTRIHPENSLLKG